MLILSYIRLELDAGTIVEPLLGRAADQEMDLGVVLEVQAGRQAVIELRGVPFAVGGEKCGKTALRNRCASWLREHLGNAGITAEIIDLSWAAKGAMTLRDRSASVVSALTFELEQRGLLDSDRARDTSSATS